MKSNSSFRRLKVSADGSGVVSHAGLGMLREIAEHTGLVAALDDAVADTYRGAWVHSPGQALTGLALAVADGADAITGIGVLGDREGVFGPVASMPTAWRVLDRVDAEHLPAVRSESLNVSDQQLRPPAHERPRLARVIHGDLRIAGRK